MANEFSATWFETFLSPTTAASIEPEIAFIRRHFPADQFPRLLDVACGIGRHAIPLASLGYEVLGVDRSAPAIEVARSNAAPGAAFRLLDMRQLDTMDQLFDGVFCLWASFGFGSDADNASLLAAMVRRLRPSGRLLLDVYNADAASLLPATEAAERASRTVTTHRRLEDQRLHVRLEYSDSQDTDSFDWRVYHPSELIELGLASGANPLVSCAWFNEEVPPSAAHLRMQMLFEKACVRPGRLTST